MNRTSRLATLALALPLLAGAGAVRAAPILLSEVLYDAVGSDDGAVFVELSGPPGSDLTGFVLEGVNGSDGSTTTSVALVGALAGDGLFVLADAPSSGPSPYARVDQLVEVDFQNGPDSIVLRDPGGAVADALGYGAFGAGDVFAGEGAPAPDAPAGSSLARLFADVDTDDNAADFGVLATPTPGQAPFAVPEPATAALLLAGLLGWRRTRNLPRRPRRSASRPASNGPSGPQAGPPTSARD